LSRGDERDKTCVIEIVPGSAGTGLKVKGRPKLRTSTGRDQQHRDGASMCIDTLSPFGAFAPHISNFQPGEPGDLRRRTIALLRRIVRTASDPAAEASGVLDDALAAIRVLRGECSPKSKGRRGQSPAIDHKEGMTPCGYPHS